MTAQLTPGAYLKHRRQAAGLSIVGVAAEIATEPRTAEHLRGEWLELIEADAAPMSLSTIVALRRVFRFDFDILFLLEAIRQGASVPAPVLCRICACSDLDGCGPDRGGPCWWAAPDLCSSCGGDVAQAQAA